MGQKVTQVVQLYICRPLFFVFGWSNTNYWKEMQFFVRLK